MSKARPETSRACSNCGQRFSPSRQGGEFCGSACRKEAWDPSLDPIRQALRGLGEAERSRRRNGDGRNDGHAEVIEILQEEALQYQPRRRWPELDWPRTATWAECRAGMFVPAWESNKRAAA